jgi:AraC family transcriptional regulator of adaptative response/methylated-DNA-[protein]-cysteine methyltransferase
MPATKALRHSPRETIHFARGNSKFGHALVAWSGKGVCAILMQDNVQALTEELSTLFPKADLIEDISRGNAFARVLKIVDNPRLAGDVPLDVRGTTFQRRVWRALGAIPVGSTASYAEIARTIGAPRAVRAVARACASNVLAVAIPCHRVVRSDGALSGYRWGIDRKRKLLESEARR